MKSGFPVYTYPTHGRFSSADDLTFSSVTDQRNLIGQIIGAIRSDGFKINHSKASYKTKNPIVTGVVVKNNSLGLTTSLKEKVANGNLLTQEQQKGLRLYVNKVLTA
jgi:hypothetical protein